MQDAKEEVRARLNIEDVIGEYVQLKRAGRNFKGLSPFTSEKTPSFTVSPEKHIWHDFSSGKGGDIFSFVMEVEGLDFRAALELLARKAGVDLSRYQSKEAGEINRKRQRMAEANELAARYFQQNLIKNKHALQYVFQQRALTKDIVQLFRIGYAPEQKDGLVKALSKRGFSNIEISEAGLMNRFEGDLFRGRMMLPLMDSSGKVIGFTGRILKDDPSAPKYLNTPSTYLYDKSRHVFALSQAKAALIKSNRAVLVEGNMDAVSAHQAGTQQVVAIAGTAFTEQHLKQLSSYVKEICLCLDADKAGIAAAQRAISQVIEFNKRFEKHSEQIKMTAISLPEGYKDPDELIKSDLAKWQGLVEEGQDITEWVIKTLVNQHTDGGRLGSVNVQEQLLEDIIPMIIKFSSRVREEYYIEYLMRQAPFNSIAVQEQLEFARQNAGSAMPLKKPSKTVRESARANLFAYQDNLLAVLVAYPATRHHLGGFDTGMFVGNERQKLAEWLKRHDKPLTDVPAALLPLETYVKIVQLKAETRYDGWSEQDSSLEVAKLLRQTEVEHKKQTKQRLINELRNAEADGDDQVAERLRSELHALIKETA